MRAYETELKVASCMCSPPTQLQQVWGGVPCGEELELCEGGPQR